MVKRRRDACEGDIVMNREHVCPELKIVFHHKLFLKGKMKMKKVKQLLFALLTICVIMCNVCAVTAVAATLTQDDVIAASIFTENEELSPMSANLCSSCDYATFHDLLDAQGIGYTGEANHTQLQSGYSYTYTKSCDHWSIYLEGPN